MTNKPVVYEIDGRKIKSANDFYREIGRAVNGPGGYFGRNLDALADCLRGGFGTPEDQPFEFVWRHMATSRRHLDKSFVDSVRDVFTDVGVTLKSH
ncbi:barstar family protein [Mycobacterium sp. 3519A]|uniref:barstar family protein n=1 Tax=Mycobacterium sp. 3519A TaxID=2057184 RepID=UPI000C7A50AC|nr:barstar family protein [Mycobacterium sp. 3519A]